MDSLEWCNEIEMLHFEGIAWKKGRVILQYIEKL